RYEELVTCGLVHGTRALPVGPAERGGFFPATDALLTAAPDIPLLLCFADCVPIILYDPARRAVGLVHAGWRGTLAGASATAVAQMAATYGSRPADLHAAIGPAIGPCCYEVGPEVVERVCAAIPDAASVLRDGHGDRAHFDLWEANRKQLVAAGVGQVEVAGLCTACHRDEFFSHRGDGGRTGRFGVVVMLR
ncbi:MAG: peptidoglycan editing factor PgeF, partial [Anaerolineae bacterium]|nr:peptidoglycan editing factor PgeF [Anaerolineae bacterium]